MPASLAGNMRANCAVRSGSAITFAGTTIVGGSVGVSPNDALADSGEDDGAGDFTNSMNSTWTAVRATQVDATIVTSVHNVGRGRAPGPRASGTISIMANAAVALDGQNDPRSSLKLRPPRTPVQAAMSS